MSNPGYRSGDFWRNCDECGFRFRASETYHRWDGLITCYADWEPRHPQDYVRGTKDRIRVPDPRPEGPDVFLPTIGGGQAIGLLLALTHPSRNIG